jgi:hypothetical protein
MHARRSSFFSFDSLFSSIKATCFITYEWCKPMLGWYQENDENYPSF